MNAIIEEGRERINELDSQIVALLNQRAEHALVIGREKQKRGQPLHASEREAEVYKRVIAANRGPFDKEAILRIFRAIVDASRQLQERQFRP